jgi:uncharacterized protein
VSPYNNPALQLFMLAAMKGYGFNWPIDGNKLLLTSVGCGWRHPRPSLEQGSKMPALGLAIHALQGLSWDTQVQTLQLLQWLSQSARPWLINSEIGTLEGEVLGGRELLTFQRYDMKFESNWLPEQTGQTISKLDLARLDNFVEPRIMQEVYGIAAAMAEKEVRPDDFPATFNVS